MSIKRFLLNGHVLAIFATGVILYTLLLLQPLFGGFVPIIPFFLGIVIAAWQGGLRAGLVATVLSTLASLYFFMEPFHTAAPYDQIRVGSLLVGGVLCSLVISQLLKAERWAFRKALEREEQLKREITERNQVEEALRQALAKAEEGDRLLSALMDYVPEGIAIADAELSLIRVSRHGQELLGGHHTGKSIAEVTAEWKVHHADGTTPMAFEELPLVRAIARGEVVENTELVQINAQSKLLPLLCTAGPLRDSAGRIVGGIVAWRDITERNRAEEALREADRRKNEFLAMLGHELRNPLAPIRNAMQLMRKLEMPDPRLHWARDVVDRQINHLARLVDDLLDVSRIVQGKLTLKKAPVDLATVINQTVETCHPLIEVRQHTLEVSLPQEPLCVDGDSMRLVQVVSNLLDNAAKYMPEGGRVWLTLVHEHGEAVLSVRDTGEGLSQSLLDQVFEVFVQAERSLDRSQGGLGLGLAIVRNIVALHGGRIEARSEGPGQGSEFIVRLPVLDYGPAQSLAAQ